MIHKTQIGSRKIKKAIKKQSIILAAAQTLSSKKLSKTKFADLKHSWSLFLIFCKRRKLNGQELTALRETRMSEASTATDG